MKKRYFIVGKLSTGVELELGPLWEPLEVTFEGVADGVVGMMAVFTSKAKAKKFAEGKYPVITGESGD